ncbi:hypothetical protein V8G54_018290 [Vigna mungo]|uniref:Uncharacterized protein n=1 Tax=Vigna mungo TaxID=3915 RepID=A0AAQ3RRA9_VIGMU
MTCNLFHIYTRRPSCRIQAKSPNEHQIKTFSRYTLHCSKEEKFDLHGEAIHGGGASGAAVTIRSAVASAVHKLPQPLLCFDLLSDLITAIDEDTKENILLWQRRCEDALYSLLVFGARRPVRHLASVAMAKVISKGDSISIYSRASSLQGFLSDGKRNEPQKIAAVMSTNIKKKQWAHFYSITVLGERRTLKDAIAKHVTAHLKPDLRYKDTHDVSYELQKPDPVEAMEIALGRSHEYNDICEKTFKQGDTQPATSP